MTDRFRHADFTSHPEERLATAQEALSNPVEELNFH